MKKLYNLFTLAMVALMSLTFTSCEDEYIASSLEGTWEGYTNMQAAYDGRYYNAALLRGRWHRQKDKNRSPSAKNQTR